MTATRLPHSATLFSVDGDTLDCSRAVAGCGYTTRARSRSVGQPCPRQGCGGVLERRRYQCELQCGCEDFQVRGRICKHLEFIVRQERKKPTKGN